MLARRPGDVLEAIERGARAQARHRVPRGGRDEHRDPDLDGRGDPSRPRSRVGANAGLAVATDAMNRPQLARLAQLVRAHVTPEAGRVGGLGLSYKPDTSVVDESPGLLLANQLAADGLPVTVFDPAAGHEARPLLATSVVGASSPAACPDGSDVVVVTVPWPAFRDLPQILAARPRPRLVVIDCWRLFDRASLEGLAQLVSGQPDAWRGEQQGIERGKEPPYHHRKPCSRSGCPLERPMSPHLSAYR